MFANVAPRYDFLNHALSGGIDILWRRRTVDRALAHGAGERRVLDLCTGTGDLALMFAARGCDVVGADFCPEMLELGRAKRGQRRVEFLGADVQHLPFRDSDFDLSTVAFGIRNVEDPVRGLREMRRVVRPGGRVLVLEFARPRAPVVGRLYLWYFRRVLPKIGALLSRASREDRAYDYLPDSVMHFPDRDDFLALMREAGLTDVRYELLSFGIAALYVGVVPDGGGSDD